MADGPPEAHRHPHAGSHMLHMLVGKPIGQVEKAFGRGLVRGIYGAGKRWKPALHPTRCDGVARRLDPQAGDVALAVDGAAQHRHMHGPVEIMASVFFPRPDQLDWGAPAVHRHAHSLGHIVDLEPAAEATAQQGHMHGHGVRRNAGDSRGDGPTHFRHLGWHPDLDLAVPDLSRAIHGLHRGVRQVGGPVPGLYAATGLVFCGLGIALLVKDVTFLSPHRCLELGIDAPRVQGATRALLPIGIYRLQWPAGHANSSWLRRRTPRLSRHMPATAPIARPQAWQAPCRHERCRTRPRAWGTDGSPRTSCQANARPGRSGRSRRLWRPHPAVARSGR